MDTKSPLASKLNWTGIFMMLIAILDMFTKDENNVIPDDWNKYILLVSGFLVVVLRTFFTTANLKFLVMLLVSLAMLSSATFAGEPVVIDTDGAAPGTYYFKVVVAVDGSATASPIRSVARVTGPPPPPPNPNPTPTPTPFQAEIERVTKSALQSGGSPTTGAAIASVYSLVADEVTKGTIPTANALAAVKTATDTVLLVQGDAQKTAWTPWRTAVGDALAKLALDGSLTTKEQYAATLRMVAAGVNKATGFTFTPAEVLALRPEQLGLLDGFDLAKLIELIKLILELLKAFRPA